MKPIPAAAGIGLRTPHIRTILDERPDIAWLEVHSENYFHPGSGMQEKLLALRPDYPISLHGVGLSLGSVDPLDREHLARLKSLVELVDPGLVSEHLCWGSVNGRHVNDLLPMPYTEEAARHVAERISETQAVLRRELLIENVSSYFEYRCSEMSEAEFLVSVAEQAGCRILLDVNNIYVAVTNNGGNVAEYIDTIPPALVGEIHLAGHSRNRFGEREILVDTHSSAVCDEVWSAYEYAIARLGVQPTLIEWDTEIPPLETLLAEARKAELLMEKAHVRAA